MDDLGTADSGRQDAEAAGRAGDEECCGLMCGCEWRVQQGVRTQRSASGRAGCKLSPGISTSSADRPGIRALSAIQHLAPLPRMGDEIAEDVQWQQVLKVGAVAVYNFGYTHAGDCLDCTDKSHVVRAERL